MNGEAGDRAAQMPSGSTNENDRVDWICEVFYALDQGVIVWSADARCVMFNPRIFDVLELTGQDLFIGADRSDFLDNLLQRCGFSEERAVQTDIRFATNRPFTFDLKLPSERIVSALVRPVRAGGSVMTFTDVTLDRENEVKLSQARHAALTAQHQVQEALFEQRSRQKEAQLLADLDDWLQTCKSLDELYLIVRTFMERTLRGSEGELYIYSNSRDLLDGACSWGHDMLYDHIAPDDCWALRRGRAYTYSSEEISFTCDHVADQEHSPPSDSYICMPIIAHGDTVGLFHIRIDKVDPQEVGIEDPLKFAMQCGEHVSLAIANVKLRDELRDQSTRDPLTGLYNRRYFLDALRTQIAQAARKDQQVGLISFDADHFKAFNDRFGHDAGDVVLRAVSATLAEVFQGDEIFCRYGGEEFAVLLPDTDISAALIAAEELRQTIEQAELRHVGITLPRVTISCGVSSYPAHGATPQDLIKSADDALYKAKADGRNCVRLALTS